MKWFFWLLCIIPISGITLSSCWVLHDLISYGRVDLKGLASIGVGMVLLFALLLYVKGFNEQMNRGTSKGHRGHT